MSMPDYVKSVIILYNDGSKQYFNTYRSTETKLEDKSETKIEDKSESKSEDKSKGLSEVKQIDKANPETFEDLVKLYEKLY